MSKEREIGIGIIGTGFARTTQIPAFRACVGARVIAIASAHRENAERVAREFNIAHVANNWREVLARAEVDLVSIVTPPVTHKEMALAALDAGKGVLCEKPMAINAEEASEMRARAQSTGALALIDHELRFLDGRQQMRELIHAGEIGRVRHVKLLYRADSRASNEREWNWWSDERAGGGALGAIGSHAIDAFRWLLSAEIEQVFCQLATHVAERRDAQKGALRQVTTDDEANLLVRFANTELMKNATGTISLSFTEAGRAEHRLEVFGSKGALMVEEDGQLWRAAIGLGDWEKLPIGKREPLPSGMRENGWARGFVSFARKIVEALGEGRNTIDGAATFSDGYETQLVLDAARLAHERGCWERTKI